MNAAQGTTGTGAPGAGDWRNATWGNASWRQHGCGMGRMHPFEIGAIILGFIVFWPIGLAMLGYKMFQRASGHSGGFQTAAADKWREAREAMNANRRAYGHGFGFQGADTGNAAFDEWRAQEIERLEAERRKLEEAQRDFAAFAENIRKAKDREEFERFMNDRRNGPTGGHAKGVDPAA
jgi:Protein of unknown function (DUF2852)